MSQKRESIRGKIEAATKALAASENSLKIANTSNEELTRKCEVSENLVKEYKAASTKRLKEVSKLKAELKMAKDNIEAKGITIDARNKSIGELNDALGTCKSVARSTNNRVLNLEEKLSETLNTIVDKSFTITSLKMRITGFQDQSWADRVRASWSKAGVAAYFKNVM